MILPGEHAPVDLREETKGAFVRHGWRVIPLHGPIDFVVMKQGFHVWVKVGGRPRGRETPGTGLFRERVIAQCGIYADIGTAEELMRDLIALDLKATNRLKKGLSTRRN